MIDLQTQKPLKFASSKELIAFLRRQNPTFLKRYKEQYHAENPDYSIVGIGSDVKIIKGVVRGAWG